MPCPDKSDELSPDVRKGVLYSGGGAWEDVSYAPTDLVASVRVCGANRYVKRHLYAELGSSGDPTGRFFYFDHGMLRVCDLSACPGAA